MKPQPLIVGLFLFVLLAAALMLGGCAGTIPSTLLDGKDAVCTPLCDAEGSGLTLAIKNGETCVCLDRDPMTNEIRRWEIPIPKSTVLAKVRR